MPFPEMLTSFLPFLNKRPKEDGSEKFFGVKESAEIVDYVSTEFEIALDHAYKEHERESKAWKMFTGFNNGQWDEDIISKMKEEGRNPFQGNIIQPKVETIAGAFLKNFYDIGFEPFDGVHSDLTRAMADLMMRDKEMMNWNQSYEQWLVDFLVHIGIEEIYISDRYDPLGSIGFRPIMRGHCVLDPHWLSNDTWDLKRAWKVAYLTPKQIKETYETHSDEIDFYLKMREGKNSEYEQQDETKGIPHFSLTEQFGDQYRVIEFKHIEREKKKIEFAFNSNGDMLQVPDIEDEAYIQQWMIANGVDVSLDPITRTEPVDILYVTTICPQISRNLVLEDKKSKIQIGRLDIFPGSCRRYNGINGGIPELLQSIQETYNKRESQVDFMIATSASGGVLMDPDIVDNDDYAKKKIEENWNKPNFKDWSAPGKLASGRNYFAQLPKNQIDFQIVNEITRMLEMSDFISKTPAAMDGRSEGSEDRSGILLARRQLQAETALTLMKNRIQQHWNDKGEAYFLLAKQLYSGVYRMITIPSTGKTIEINKPIVTLNGEVLENDISTLPRMKVCVTESPEGETNRLMDRATNIELLRVLGPESPIQRARAAGKAVNTINKSKEDKVITEQDTELEIDLVRKRVMAEIMGLDLQMMQMQMQMMQLGQPQLPVSGAPQMGGGGEQQSGPPMAEGNPNAQMQGNNMTAMGLQ